MKPKSGIKGHRIWWTIDYMAGIQFSLRMGFIFGLLASIIYDQNVGAGVFGNIPAQLVGLAAIWCMADGAMRYMIMTRHEEGPRIEIPDLELP